MRLAFYFYFFEKNKKKFNGFLSRHLFLLFSLKEKQNKKYNPSVIPYLGKDVSKKNQVRIQRSCYISGRYGSMS